MDFWSQIDVVRERWNVLEHPFYQRWSAGELEREELAFYAGEYRHAVVALADATAGAARSAEPGALRAELELHAAEEASHVDLWDDFARAVGGSVDATPRAETVACAQAWTGERERDVTSSLVALYAIEAAQPAISETKLEGLREHYGIDGESETAYFTLHAELDKVHAAAGRRRIEERLDGADVDALIAEAEAVLRANWELLDGCERAAGR